MVHLAGRPIFDRCFEIDERGREREKERKGEAEANAAPDDVFLSSNFFFGYVWAVQSRLTRREDLPLAPSAVHSSSEKQTKMAVEERHTVNPDNRLKSLTASRKQAIQGRESVNRARIQRQATV